MLEIDSAPTKQSLTEQAYGRIRQAIICWDLEPGEQVAGRRTIAVVAVPRNEGLPVRRYTIDQERSYMLRLETIGDDDRPNVLLDTKDISFPTDVDARLFDVQDLAAQRQDRLRRAVAALLG